MLTLSSKPTLADLQAYIKQMEVERGFTENDVILKGFKMVEEVGELFRAILKTKKGSRRSAESGTEFDVAGEFADVLIYLLAMANLMDVDLEKAFRDKEEINKQRVWKKIG